jgi:exopolysaccharide production protein ExoQ
MTSMTVSLDPPAVPLSRRGPFLLWRTAGTVLAFMPVAMAVAHRSSPLVLALTALPVAAALTLERGWERPAADMRKSLLTPLGAAVAAFFAWSVVSLLWSEFRGASAYALLEFWFPVAVSLFLAVTLPHRLPRWGVWVVAGAIAMACAVILAELYTGLVVRRLLGMRAATFIFNRPVLTLLVGLVPVLAALRRHGPWGWAAGAGLAALSLVTIAQSESGAAALGAAVACAATLAAFLAPRQVVRAASVAVVVAVATAPLVGPVADRLIPPSLHERLADSHSRDRIDIWMSFGAVVLARPWLGTGFGTSPHLGASSVAAEVAPERRTLLAVGHPHNATLQIWTELGAVGAVLAGLVLLLAVRALSHFPRRDLAPMVGLIAGAAAVSLVGHGAWQGWWPAALGAAVVWFRFAHRHGPETAR